MADSDDIQNDLNTASQRLNAAAKSLETLGKNLTGGLKRFSSKSTKIGASQLSVLKEIKDILKGGVSLGSSNGGGNGGGGEASHAVVDAIEQLTDITERGTVEATLQESYDPIFKLTKSLEEGFAGFLRSSQDEEDLEKKSRAHERQLHAEKLESDKEGYEKWALALKSDTKERADFEEALSVQDSKERRLQDRYMVKRLGGALTIPVNKFVQYLGKVFSRAFEIQDASLKFNRTFNETMKNSSNKIAGLPGGLSTRLDTLFAFQAQGMGQLGSTSMALAARMRLTGQEMGSLISTQQKLITVGGLTRVQTEALAATLLRTSISQNVAIDRLVAGLDQLKQSLSTLALGGTTSTVSKAIAELSADFPGMSEQIGSFVDKLASADISQAAVLGAIPDLEAITSGAIRSGAELRAVISRLASGAFRFTQGFKNLNIGTKKAIEGIVGDLGTMSQVLNQNLLDFVATAKGSTDRILTSLRVAVDEALFPFEEALTNVITKLAAFGGHLAAFAKKMDSSTGGFLGMDKIITAVVGSLLLKRALPGVTKVASRTGANFFMVAFAKFGKIFSGGLLRGIARIGSKFLGPVGIILTLLEVIAWATGDSAKAERSSEEKLDELVKIESARDKERLGSSRFERLTLKVIQDSLFARTAMESIMSQHMGRQGDLLTEIRDDGRIPKDPVEIGVPVR